MGARGNGALASGDVGDARRGTLMPTATIHFKSIADWVASRKRLGDDFMPAMRRGLLSGALRCIPILHESTREADAFNTGRYLRAWRSGPTEHGARVYNGVPYAGVIESGRRRGKFPPIETIKRWAQRKLGLSRREAERAAFPIARAIARRGLRARHVMSSRKDAMIAAVREEVMRELHAAYTAPQSHGAPSGGHGGGHH